MEVTVVSLYSNRPDFIKPQFQYMQKYLKDPFRFIVVNNSYYGQDKPEEIEALAIEEGIEHLRIHHGGYKPEPSALVRDALEYIWQEMKHTKGILAIVDSDLFFTNPVSFNSVLDGYDMAFCPNYTEGKIWPWTGLMLFNMDKVVVDDITFGFECLNGTKYEDVGSAVYQYIARYNPNIRLLDRTNILDTDYPIKNERLSSLGFPHPYSIDVVGLDGEPFMFHYKTSSNYAVHCTKEYNEQKTEALNKLLAL